MLTLPLLVLRLKLVDDVDPSLTADDFVVRTDFFDASTYFHVRIMLLPAMTHCL